MIRDCGDILDRWSISALKAKRIGNEENQKEFKAFDFALEEIKLLHSKYNWKQFCDMMLYINDSIWQLESGLKSSKEELPEPHYILDRKNTEVLAKIGLTTILIRNFNHIRVQFKNLINDLLKEGFQDSKQDHLSA